MRRSRVVLCLVTVISLLLNVIWPCQAVAVDAPVLAPLGQLKANGVMLTPGALDVDAAGNLFVAEIYNHGDVHKFDQYGRLLATFEVGGTGAGIAVSAIDDGYKLYVAKTQSVAILDAASGEELGFLGDPTADVPEFESVNALDLDSSGNVFVVDGQARVVKVYNPAGSYLYSINGAGATTGPFQQIGAMAVSPNNQLIVVDNSATNALVYVVSFTLDQNLAPKVVAVAGLSRKDAFDDPAKTTKTPLLVGHGIAFDHLSRAYFLEFMRAEIRMLDASLAYLSTYEGKVAAAAGKLSTVKDVAFDAVNKRLFVSGNGSHVAVFGIDGATNPLRENNKPTVPEQLSPVEGAEVVSTTPTLVIGNAEDADGDALTYRVVVRQNDTVVFQDDVAESLSADNTTTVMVTGVELTENVTYSWTVQASDDPAFAAETSSAVSGAVKFSVNVFDEAPSASELVAPLDGATINGLDILSWEEANDPDPNDSSVLYQVTIALDEAFTQVVATELTTATSLVLGDFTDYNALADGSRYFWQVVVFDFDDDQKFSVATDSRQFLYDTTSLTVTANMPGATVSISGNHGFSGREIGVAPFELRDFPAGIFSIVVERAGFEPFVAQVNLADQGSVDLYARLVPAMATENLAVRTDSINGRTGLSVDGTAAPFLVDFDNDGLLDLLVGDAAGQITLYPSMAMSVRRGLSFQPGTTLDLPVLPGAVPFVVDWNNDGRKDLLIGAADGSVKLFLNQGLEEAPAFGVTAIGKDLSAGGSTLAVGNSAAPAVLDYNGDGKKDLVVGNASGQVLVCLNEGSDAEPQLAAPVEILLVGSSVVPFPVDWNADGQKELLITSGGRITIYAKVDGVYLPTKEFSDIKVQFNAAFPIDLTGDKGKELLVGDLAGKMEYMTGFNNDYAESFSAALLDKVDQLEELVTPNELYEVAVIRTLIETSDYVGVKERTEALVMQLVTVEGLEEAQIAATELAELF